MQISLGSSYINDFNLFGFTHQAISLADSRYRDTTDDIEGLQIRSTNNTMIPLTRLGECEKNLLTALEEVENAMSSLSREGERVRAGRYQEFHKGSIMSGPTTRVMALLEMLQSHGRMTGGEIAQRLNVDVRTARRYITVLEELGIPVTTEQGRYGGYMLVAGFKLPPMMFTDEETLAVSLGLLAAQQLGLAESTPAIASVQAKLERVMPANLKQRVRAVSDTTRLILPRVEPSYDNRTLLTLTTAIQSERRVSFVYRSPQDEVMQRDMDPYGLVFRRGRWYVSGFCHLRAELRSFRLDRISSVKALEHQFKRPERFDAAEHLSRSLSSMPRSLPVSVVLHTDADTAGKMFGFHPNTVDLFQQQDDGLLLETHTDSYDWFASWLAHMPFAFTVQSPPELQQALRDQAQRLLDAAGC